MYTCKLATWRNVFTIAIALLSLNVDIICLPTVYRHSIAERRSYIETLHKNIKKLEDDIRVKQSTVMHSKANVKRYGGNT